MATATKKATQDNPANAENVTEKVSQAAQSGAIRTITQKAKITLTDFRPKRIHNEPESVTRMLVGTLIGRADGVVERRSPAGDQTFAGLSGVFEAHVTGAEPVRSGILFMPESFQEPLIKLLSDETDEKTGEVLTPGANAINIAYRVFVARSGNAAGYSWELDQIIDDKNIVEVDPLAGMRGLLGSPNLKALPSS